MEEIKRICAEVGLMLDHQLPELGFFDRVIFGFTEIFYDITQDMQNGK